MYIFAILPLNARESYNIVMIALLKLISKLLLTGMWPMGLFFKGGWVIVMFFQLLISWLFSCLFSIFSAGKKKLF